MKKISLIILLGFFYPMVVDSVDAHTYLQESIPNQGEVVTKPISELLLTFETKIENGSKLELVNRSNDSTIIPEEITIETNRMEARFPDLTTGEYRVIWKVIGADGHIIEGDYSFTVNVTENPDKKKSDGDEAVATDTVKNAVSNDDSTGKQSTVDNTTHELSVISIMLGILGIIVGVGLLIRFRKGR